MKEFPAPFSHSCVGVTVLGSPKRKLGRYIGWYNVAETQMAAGISVHVDA